MDNNVKEFSCRVLIAEDDETSGIMLKKILNKFGLDSVLVKNGLEAVEYYKKEEFDLILMDIQMPIMDGIEATRQIRDTSKNKERRIPIIAATAYVLSSNLDRCLEIGMDDYISKPINFKLLDQKIKQYLY